MKKLLLPLVAFVLCVNLVQAQMGGGGAGPKFDSAMIKLFGANSAFSARMEMHAVVNGQDTIMPGKFALLDGNSRLDMDLEEMTGGSLPPQFMTQMKAMGMDKITAITRPDKQLAYVVYPALKAYAASAINDPSATNSAVNFKLETTDLGKEDMDGHPCVKEQATVTDDKGFEHHSILWKATDLNQFPIKIELTEGGQTITMLYEDIKLSKPDASLFEPPSGYTRYTSMPELIQTEVSKRMGGGPPPAGQ